MSAEPEPQPPADALQFDRAEHVEPTRALVCGRCEKPITDTYYHDGDKTLCADCGRVRQQLTVSDRSVRTLVRAGAYGVGAAIAGALLYYGVMEYLGVEIGIVAIAIGWLVGRAVANATHGRSARRHQVMAALLTYLAVSLAYAPFAMKAAKEHKAATVVADSAKTTPTTAARDSTKTESIGFGGFMLALTVLLGFVLALPVAAAFASMPGGLLSILIIGIGLVQAWKISAASNAMVTGPHAIGSTATV